MRLARFRKLFCLLLCLQGVAVFAETASPDQIRLATSTSLQSSGFLDVLIKAFQTRHAYTFEIHSVGSGRALRMARSGSADVVLVHSPLAERELVQQGFGLERHSIMRNDFVLAGPTDDPGQLSRFDDILAALQYISRNQIMFVSRGDDSGTHKKERSLFRLANVKPFMKPWFYETGLGMTGTLRVAERERAYLLIDRAVFLVLKSADFKVIIEDPVHMDNVYSVIAVNPDKFPDVNKEGAMAFIDWLRSEEGKREIDGFSVNGEKLYQPL